MISVSIARLETLDDEEAGLLVKYCHKCFEPVAYEDLVHRVRSGAACIYRFSGDCRGIFILATGDNGLYVETVAGREVVKNFDKLYDKIRAVATATGAKSLYSFVSRPALQRLYEKRTKAKNVATLYREALR